MHKVINVIFFLILFSFKNAFCQESNKLISVNYNKIKVNELVTDLEVKSGMRFYYDSLLMDSIRVSININQKPLSFILEQTFSNSGVYFLINKNDIFLTKNKLLTLELAPGYNDTDKNIVNQSIQIGPTETVKQDEKIQRAVISTKTYEIGVKTNEIRKGSSTIAGYIFDSKTGLPIEGASISNIGKILSISDQSGFFTITLPHGKYNLDIKSTTSRDTRRQIILYGDGLLNIELDEKITALKEVKVVSDKVSNIRSLEMGVSRLDIKTIKKIPSVFGEPDILRVVLTLPGVQSVGEASTGLNVRGGSADQNLILLNDGTIYNPAHFFGFFSAFNPEIVKDIQLYKSTIPEKFGGRLSSVLEVTNREGDKNKLKGSAGLGIITSRFNIESPIDSGKTSFIFGGRGTYSNWLLKILPKEYKQSKASFYDFNLGVSHNFNKSNDIYLSAYYSKDNFKLNSDTAYSYNNKNISIKWKNTLNLNLNSILTIATSIYEYSVKSDFNPLNAYKLNFSVNQSQFKYDFNYNLNKNHVIGFGLSSTYYKLSPGEYNPINEKSLVISDVLPKEQALESAIYIGDKFDISNKFSVSAGLRYSLYNYLGPHSINNYNPNLPKTEFNILNTTVYNKNKIIKTYQGPEIRISARYNLTYDFSIKAAYNTLRQYIHLLSNTTAITPTDIWKLSDPNIKPQFGNQVSLGFYKNFKSQTIETSVEIYYKKLKDYLDYKSGANLVLNHHIETDVVNTRGKAYGAEFLVKKPSGNLNGWVSYTYSRTLLKSDNLNDGSIVNAGAYYPANYDKPHTFNFTSNYRFKQRYNLSLNITYSTGRPITLPTAKYYYAGSERVYYSDRNAYRIPDYFRTDVSFNIGGNHKVNQFGHNSWTIGLYNLTGRKNAYSTYFTQENGSIKGYKLSIFASVIPFVNYNIEF